MATEVAALPDDAVAGVFRALPLRSLAVVRCVCKAWRDIIDTRSLLFPHLVPRSVRGIFINYIDHERPHHFSRLCSSSTTPRVDGMLSFLPNADSWSSSWSVLDHCSGLLLCDMEWSTELCVCNPATRRWTVLPGRHADDRWHRHYAGAYIAFDPAASPHYQVILVPDVPEAPSREDRRKAEKEPFCLD
ncbi:unnamed protein product [Miscanthus lutarioriparius]|uniref:F-box domain-containing protein n=1 Tax=Miscanthus lutarioriparius TaxID=422564 RepID=A0A811QZS5_9POAL|nr:unnamed protein product [Miscanthus lutarioriparius]